jgi:splicing factor 3B subunit 2
MRALMIFGCGPLQVDLLKNQKSDKVDVTIQPEELEVMDDVLAAK